MLASQYHAKGLALVSTLFPHRVRTSSDPFSPSVGTASGLPSIQRVRCIRIGVYPEMPVGVHRGSD